MQKYYSTEKFWERVNMVLQTPKRDEIGFMYIAACHLQDIEVRVLQMLENLEENPHI